jgi:hypothetical protein
VGQVRGALADVFFANGDSRGRPTDEASRERRRGIGRPASGFWALEGGGIWVVKKCGCVAFGKMDELRCRRKKVSPGTLLSSPLRS